MESQLEFISKSILQGRSVEQMLRDEAAAIKTVPNKPKETITIGDSYDGFTLTYGEFSVWVSQEDSPVEPLKKFFKKLRYKVEIEQEC